MASADCPISIMTFWEDPELVHAHPHSRARPETKPRHKQWRPIQFTPQSRSMSVPAPSSLGTSSTFLTSPAACKIADDCVCDMTMVLEALSGNCDSLTGAWLASSPRSSRCAADIVIFLADSIADRRSSRRGISYGPALLRRHWLQHKHHPACE
jgi:hypothetical protein